MILNRLSKMMLALALVFTVFASAGQVNAASATTAVNVTIDGVKQSYKQPAVLSNGSVLVPLRPIFEALGAQLHWDANEKVATAYKDNQIVSLRIGSSEARIGDSYVGLNQPAQIIKGNTLVPVRFVSEGLGAEVKWNSATKTVEIKKRDASPDKQVYGYTMNVTQDLLQSISVYGVSHIGNIASSTPLLAGREFYYYFDDLVGEGDKVDFPFARIRTFNGDAAAFEQADHEDFTYLATANGITFAYDLMFDSADQVRELIYEDYNYYGEELSDAGYNRVAKAFEQFPAAIQSFQMVTQKPAATTLTNSRSYDGLWKGAENGSISLTFITDNEAILKYSEYGVDTVVSFFSDNTLNYHFYDKFIIAEDGKLSLERPIVIDGMFDGEYETITFTK